jgi:hypothetical protein
MLCAYSQHLCYTCSRTNLKGNTMLYRDIFDIQRDLRTFGFWYCVWRKDSLWEIFIASRMNKHDTHSII